MYTTRYEFRRPILGVPELINQLAQAIARGTEVVIELEAVEGQHMIFNVRVNDGPFCATLERVEGELV